ncbi:MAG: pyruvate formate lyase family protein [bacterium]
MTCEPAQLWSPSDGLSTRVKKLRGEYFSFYERDHFRNEVQAFTTGKPYDTVWAPHQWGVVPEIYMFFDAYRDSLLASASTVKLKAGFRREPLIVRRALFFREVVTKHLPVKILDGELIVGAHFNTALSKTHTKSEAKKYNRRIRKWLREARRLNAAGVGNCGATPGHLIPDYPEVLKTGFSGIHDRLTSQMKNRADAKGRNLLKAMLICCEAAAGFAERCAGEAERLAENEPDEKRAGELRAIALICRKVPWEPAETFHEALQSLWFTHMLVMAAESYPGPGLSYGRIDQYLLPFYRRDVSERKITREDARELLHCWWIKHNYAYDYQGRIGTNQGINSGFGQLITLSGCGPDGEDLTNELTLLMLEVIGEINLLEPKPNIRIHRNTPADFLLKVCELVSMAQGSPFLLNFDEASIRGLKWEGLPVDELWNYAPVGCLENTLQGKDRSGTVDVNVNLAKAVELALNDGRDTATGERLGPATGDPAAFHGFDDFFTAFKKQLSAILDLIIGCNNRADAIRARFEPTPYLSLLVEGCAESGKDITQGGAVHNFLTVQGIGFATAVDSVAAVKKLVYETGQISMPELLRAIRANFEGYEPLRQALLNRAPKYGNDDPAADDIAREVSRFWTEAVFREKSPATAKRYRGGYLSWNYWISYAPSTAATPDGRRRGTFLSNGICAVNGMAAAGPTAAALSAGRLSLETAPNGASHTISLNPTLVRDGEHLEKLAGFLRAYNECGGTALQINMITPDTLRAALENPEDHRNLLVRVTGYNAYFVMLGREIQNEIIARESLNLG